MDRQTGRQIDGQTDRQADRVNDSKLLINTLTHVHLRSEWCEHDAHTYIHYSKQK